MTQCIDGAAHPCPYSKECKGGKGAPCRLRKEANEKKTK